MIISFDVEATGLDIAHGVKPFLVTSTEEDGTIRYWEWSVDPLTRIPEIPEDDLADIAELLDAADIIYLQNAKYDARAIRTIGLELPWDKVRDTLIMGHLLASNHPHNLTDMCMEYLHRDIEPFEKAIEGVCKIARAIVRRDYPSWKIANEGVEGMPSVTGSSKRDEDKPWKNDMWLPRALIKAGCKQYIPEAWATVCSDYANADSEHDLYLGLELDRLIVERGLQAIYEHRMKLVRIACEMEEYGVTCIGSYTESTITQYQEYTAESANKMHCIAAKYNYDLELAEGASLNDSMREFFYGSIRQACPNCKYRRVVKHWNGEEPSQEPCPKCLTRKKLPQRVTLTTTRIDTLNLQVITSKKSGNASLDKDAMQEYLATLDGDALEFVKLLTDKRKYDTDLTYMHAYRRFWLPIYIEGCVGNGYETGYYRIHPSLNPCGTDHLRWSSNSPNCQNISKLEEGNRISIRNCFGPAPDREWWSMDFQNIELRIPAYESGEEAMIELFEKPTEPPYFGSYHCLNASIVYPDLFWPLAETEGAFKKKYKSTEYQWCKNGGFAIQYGCGERKADNTFRRRGAYKLLKQKLPKVAALNQKYITLAERTGWIETLPDRSVDITRGYPILASRTEDNKVLSTTPFNYHVSGTACWCKNTALIRCAAQLERWRREDNFSGYISLEVHDELLFDFPRGKTPEDNKPRAMILRKLMEQSGEDLIPRIPTPVSVELHTESWAKGVSM